MSKIYDRGFIIDYKEGDRSLERLPIEYEPRINDTIHIIKQDDTLESIAAKYYGVHDNWYIIADVNEIVNPYDLTVGDQLIIPDKAITNE